MEFVLFVFLYLTDSSSLSAPVAIKMEQVVDQAACLKRADQFRKDSQLEDEDGTIIPTVTQTLCMPADMVTFEDYTQDGLVVEQVAPKK